jgi:hypothetical protein
MRFTAFIILASFALSGCSSGGGGSSTDDGAVHDGGYVGDGDDDGDNVDDGGSGLTQPGVTSAVTLNWQAPTENSDGSPLLDLAGYYIYVGREPETYDDTILIDNPGITTFVVDNLEPGTYYLAATAFNASGAESRFSAELIVHVS